MMCEETFCVDVVVSESNEARIDEVNHEETCSCSTNQLCEQIRQLWAIQVRHDDLLDHDDETVDVQCSLTQWNVMLKPVDCDAYWVDAL